MTPLFSMSDCVISHVFCPGECAFFILPVLRLEIILNAFISRVLDQNLAFFQEIGFLPISTFFN